MYINNIAKKKDLLHKPFFFFSRGEVLCIYPVLPSSVHVCIYFEWFPLWLFLELDFLSWNIVLEVSGPVYNLFLCYYKEKSSLHSVFTS